MNRLLIIPAAGKGTRLQANVPKFLYSVNGQPMIDRLITMYAAYVDHYVVVVNADHLEIAAQHFRQRSNISLVTQAEASGMLDAILLARDTVDALMPQSIWITWCDQIAVRRETLRRLADLTDSETQALLTFPTIVRSDPYIHFERDGERNIIGLLQRREGDDMPDTGENDLGLFAMTMACYNLLSDSFSRIIVNGSTTRENNFLPFIPWLSRSSPVSTFPAIDVSEAIGVNTVAEAERLALVLRQEPGR